MFIENVIFIMKNILENKAEQPNDHLGITSIEGLMLAVVRYVCITLRYSDILVLKNILVLVLVTKISLLHYS